MCPPLCLIPRVFGTQPLIGQCYVRIVILLRIFVLDCMVLPTNKAAFTPGKCGSVFGIQDLSFRMLALRVNFDDYAGKL